MTCLLINFLFLAPSQYLTLAFIGFISASSMRGFLRDMRRAFSAIVVRLSQESPALQLHDINSCLSLFFCSAQVSSSVTAKSMRLAAALCHSERCFETRANPAGRPIPPDTKSLAAQGGNNVTTLVLLLTELMGFYAISSLLLIRRQLPMRYRCPQALTLSHELRVATTHECVNPSSTWLDWACFRPL